MIRFENTVTPSAEQWRAVIMGYRNPMNSWDKSDTGYFKDCSSCKYYDKNNNICQSEEWSGQPINTDNCYEFRIGPNDYNLMTRLRNAGTDHRKFMRMITVYVDITSPLYWWKEFDTYKVGTVANSCSTMHKIAEKEFTLDDFSHEHLMDMEEQEALIFYSSNVPEIFNFKGIMEQIISGLNNARQLYLETKDKKYWWQMIQLLPSSYNQKRTVMMNYEVLCNIYHSRKGHKLDEWNQFCSWIEALLYSELITGEKNDSKRED